MSPLLVTDSYFGTGSVPPMPTDMLTIFGQPAIAAAIGMISSLAMIRAAKLAPTVKLAPASYLEIASSAVMGIWIFGEYLDAMTIFGIAIIIAVCLTNSVMNELPKTRG